MMTDERYADLGQRYLVELMKADAKVWRKHQGALERGGGDDALSSPQAQKVAPHVSVEATRPKRSAIFYGRPCQTCGGTERYISTGHCVACAKASAAKSDAKRTAKPKQKSAIALARAAASAARAAAIAAGANTYRRGRPCDKCGHDVFYVLHCSCATCKRARRPVRTQRGTEPSVPRLSQYKRLDTAHRPASPRMPQRTAMG